MKIIKRGSGNHISKIEACCKYCNSMLEFYLNIGDKRVTDKDHSCDSRVRYICPVCGERNEILNLYYIKKDRGVYIHTRTHVFEAGLVDDAKNSEIVKAFMDYEIKEVASYTKLAVPGDHSRSVMWLTLQSKEG